MLVNVLLKHLKYKSTGSSDPVLIGFAVGAAKKITKKAVTIVSAILFLFLLQPQLKAQPIQVEINPGTTKYNFNSLISGFIDNDKKILFHNIAIFDQYHQTEHEMFNGGVSHSYLYRNITSNMDLGTGATFHQSFGIIPKLAFQYLYISEYFFFRVGPAITYNERLGWEVLLNLAYSKPLAENYDFVVEFRSINNYARFFHHNRSLHQIKLGLASGTYTVGIESTVDQIGLNRNGIQSLGFFLSYRIL